MEPAVILSLHPHVTIEYDTEHHPNNKCTFPATAKNSSDVSAQLSKLMANVFAMETLADNG